MSGDWRGGYIVSRGVREWGIIRVIKQAIYMWWRLMSGDWVRGYIVSMCVREWGITIYTGWMLMSGGW